MCVRNTYGCRGGAFAQFGSITPVTPYDPLYEPSAQFPYGQHWIETTKVNFAWALVGYDQYGSPPVDLGDPSRIIAIIDTGIDLDHVEFGGPPGTLGSKIHEDSRSFLQDGVAGIPPVICDCDTSQIPDFPEDTVPLFPDAGDPHGSFIAGIAAANSNGAGMAGVCWDCGLLVLRVLAFSTATCGTGSVGTYCPPTDQTLAAAIRFAAGWDDIGGEYLPEPRARIISMSSEYQGGYTGLGCAGHIIADAIDEAVMQGCIIVAIAGNQYEDCWPPANNGHCGLDSAYGEHPITGGIPIHPGTIAVGGVCLDDGPDGRWWHCRSNVNPLRSSLHPIPPDVDYCEILYPIGLEDPEPDRLPVLSVVAPMAHVFGSSGDGIVGQSNNDFAMTSDGTSFVAPQIAGIIGLMLRVNPDLMLAEVRHILEVTATDLNLRIGENTFDYVGYDRFTGHGLVNARKAVEYTRKHYLPADWNGDGHVETLDAALYLIDYTNADAMTDLNLDTIQTTDDVGIFLDSYAGQ